jgi:hypothetical protein
VVVNVFCKDMVRAATLISFNLPQHRVIERPHQRRTTLCSGKLGFADSRCLQCRIAWPMADFHEDEPDPTDRNSPAAPNLRAPRKEPDAAIATQRIRNAAAVMRAQQRVLRERQKPVRRPK